MLTLTLPPLTSTHTKPRMTHLLKRLEALISNFVLVAFGNLVKGSALQPQMHPGGSWLAALPNNLPYQC